MFRRFAFVFGLIVLLLLTSCDPDPPPACTPSDLVAPVLTSPGSYTFVGTGPTTGSIPTAFMQWDFGPDCTPEHFKLLFSEDRTFGIARSGMTDGEMNWPPEGAPAQAPLEPATEYFWRVRAWTDGVNGPDSSTNVFFTGPMCASAAEMGAPELIYPGNGEVIDELFAELHYVPGGTPCVPEGYFIDLQTTTGFDGTNLLGEYGVPGTYLLTEMLDDCTTYYWRVAPIYGGVQGPFSETRAFTVAVSPTCMTMQAPELAIDPSLLELCTPEDLEAPELYWPPHNVILWGTDLDSILIPEFFQWIPVGCAPEKYKLRFSPDPDFGFSRMGMTDGETSWPDPDAEYPQMGLEPATQYFWNVRGWSSGVNGPDSETWVFFTGPECVTPEDLVPPELLEPADGAAIPDVNLQLHYRPGEPACLPYNYYIDLQTDPEFGGTSLYDDEWASYFQFFDVTGLEDCTTYFWRVAAIEDGVIGPFSEPRSFFTNQSGLCVQSMLPQIEALRDLVCYEGPGTGYPVAGYFLQGEVAQVVAQSLNEQWWYIQNPDGPDICSIPQDGADPLDDMSDVPRWNDPEPDTPARTCRSYATEESCVSAGCDWQENYTTAGGGYCTDP